MQLSAHAGVGHKPPDAVVSGSSVLAVVVQLWVVVVGCISPQSAEPWCWKVLFDYRLKPLSIFFVIRRQAEKVSSAEDVIAQVVFRVVGHGLH